MEDQTGAGVLPGAPVSGFHAVDVLPRVPQSQRSRQGWLRSKQAKPAMAADIHDHDSGYLGVWSFSPVIQLSRGDNTPLSIVLFNNGLCCGLHGAETPRSTGRRWRAFARKEV